MSGKSVSIDRDGPVVVLRIERPQALNALNQDVLLALEAGVHAASTDSSFRVVVITGSGERAFCAGADLEELSGLDAPAADAVLRVGQRVLDSIEASPIPVIAAVNGLALGGGFELVLASTFAVLDDSASLGLPESGLGLIPGYGGTQRLTRAVGPYVARHVMLTGERLSATRAHALGLTPVEPVTNGDALAVACDIAKRVAARGPRATTAIMEAVRLGQDAPAATALALERGLAALAISSSEASEGVAAFREKRTPDFSASISRSDAS